MVYSQQLRYSLLSATDIKRSRFTEVKGKHSHRAVLLHRVRAPACSTLLSRLNLQRKAILFGPNH